MFDVRALPEDEECEYERRIEIGEAAGHKPTLQTIKAHDWYECQCGWESAKRLDSTDSAWTAWESHAEGEGISFAEA